MENGCPTEVRRPPRTVAESGSLAELDQLFAVLPENNFHAKDESVISRVEIVLEQNSELVGRVVVVVVFCVGIVLEQ